MAYYGPTPVVVNTGGTGAATLTNHGVVIGQGTSAVHITSAGSAGQVLQSGGGSADPTYSTPTFPSASGTAGKVLVSDGTNNVYSTPTFPNASATSGKFIRSDGTNWIASTPTFPTSAGSAGKVLMSNATNYVESTPTYPSASGGAGVILRSDGTNNVYTTATYPTTTTINQILYSSAASVISGLATANSGVLITNSSGVPSIQAAQTSWTPAYNVAGSTTGITYTTQIGQYTALGNIIFFNCTIVLSSKGAGSGNITITGLPTNSINTSGQVFISKLIILGITVSTETEFYASQAAAATTLTLNVINTPTGASAIVQNSQMSGTGTIYINGFYFTA